MKIDGSNFCLKKKFAEECSCPEIRPYRSDLDLDMAVGRELRSKTGFSVERSEPGVEGTSSFESQFGTPSSDDIEPRVRDIHFKGPVREKPLQIQILAFENGSKRFSPQQRSFLMRREDAEMTQVHFDSGERSGWIRDFAFEPTLTGQTKASVFEIHSVRTN